MDVLFYDIYIMSLNLEVLVSSFRQEVRFNQAIDPDIPVLDDILVSPASARLVYHPLLTPGNLYAISPNFSNYSTPPTPTLLNSFSDWLYGVRDESIRTIIQSIYNAKKSKGKARETLHNQILFTGVGSIFDKIVKSDRLVGFEIELLNSNNLTVALNSIMLQFTEANPALTLHLYHSDRADRIATLEFNYDVPVSAKWVSPSSSIELKFRDLSNNIASGRYYLMYDESSILGQAVNKRFNFHTAPCGSCSTHNLDAYKNYSKYVRIRTCFVGYANKPGDLSEMFDVKKLSYQENSNFGLNLNLDAGCDLTDFFLERKRVMGDAIANQLRYDLLTEMAHSVRENALSDRVKEQAAFALQNVENGGGNATAYLQEAKNALALELSDVEENVCSPKPRAQTIKQTAIRTAYGRTGGY